MNWIYYSGAWKMVKYLNEIYLLLKKQNKQLRIPVINTLPKDPFKVLIATILSLRTKDEVTRKTFNKLIKKADSPNKILKLSDKQIEKLIYPTGFYKTKAKNIKKICKEIVFKYKGKIPNSEEKLLGFKGVGRKTTNLVLGYSFGIPSICVDTHYHRIINRLGVAKTKDPYKTELKVMELLPKKYWIESNNIFVAHGQNICKPINPFCSKCKIKKYCKKVDVEKFR